MAFEGLADKLGNAFKKLKNKGKLSEKDVKEAMREVRLALLEADVNYKVAKDFTNKVTERAVGQDVMQSLTPAQMVVKIVDEELTSLMGGEDARIELASKPPTVIMMCGLQGSGKTTTAGKIAKLITEKQGKKPLLVAGDIYRPAAIDQLKTLGAQLNIPVFSKGTDTPVETIVTEALAKARDDHNDVVIIDTAGRLQIDEKLMQELANVKEIAHPDEILLVVDSLAGQEIVNVASTFNERLGITGAVLTKLDGDARGGGALSIRHVTHVPIKYIGTGEKLGEIDYFYPDRMADRILGMGDVVSLVEKVQDVYDEKESMKAFNKMKAGTFGLDDMLDQMKKLQKMGPLSGLLKMIPGMPKIPNLNDDDAAAKMKMTESIIYSMTKAERANPDMINSSRKERIAKGCGQPVTEVNKLLKQFEQSRKVMKQLGNIDPTTGMPTQRPMKNQQQFNPYRKKTRHKKKKK